MCVCACVCVFVHAWRSVFLCVCICLDDRISFSNVCVLMMPECLCVLLLLLNKQLIQSEALTWIDAAFCSWQLAMAIHLQPIF